MRMVDQLRDRARGVVITPDDDGYELTRGVHKAMIERRPALVVRCANAGDVRAAVRFAAENELDVAVRGGGIGYLSRSAGCPATT
ncbi:MAG TPA: FAD-binding protein, partial [Actinomycetes bacterium]|nr:FAD-binding protein [Actinomycetes bacterium]